MEIPIFRFTETSPRSPWLTWANALSWNVLSRAPPCTTCSPIWNVVIGGEIQCVWSNFSFFLLLPNWDFNLQKLGKVVLLPTKFLSILPTNAKHDQLHKRRTEALSEACPGKENSHGSSMVFGIQEITMWVCERVFFQNDKLSELTWSSCLKGFWSIAHR